MWRLPHKAAVSDYPILNRLRVTYRCYDSLYGVAKVRGFVETKLIHVTSVSMLFVLLNSPVSPIGHPVDCTEPFVKRVTRLVSNGWIKSALAIIDLSSLEYRISTIQHRASSNDTRTAPIL